MNRKLTGITILLAGVLLLSTLIIIIPNAGEDPPTVMNQPTHISVLI